MARAPLSSLTLIESLYLSTNKIESGIESLVTLQNPISLDFTFNETLPCAQLATLETHFGHDIVVEPLHCAE